MKPVFGPRSAFVVQIWHGKDYRPDSDLFYSSVCVITFRTDGVSKKNVCGELAFFQDHTYMYISGMAELCSAKSPWKLEHKSLGN